MGKRSSEYTRKQLIGILAAYRGALFDAARGELNAEGRSDAALLLRQTAMDADPEDLMEDGSFDESWIPE